MRRGKLLDRLLFQTGAEIVIVDADSWRTKDAQARREAAENEGKIAVLRDKFDEAERIANNMRATLFDRGINLNDAKAQHRVIWDSNGVACKGFLDLLFVDAAAETATIFDLKIVENAAPSDLRVDFRASLQHAAYVEAIETLQPELTGRVKMRFILAEPDGDDLTIAEPDGALRSLGQSRWKRAVATWKECLASGKFPGHPRDVATLSAKPWELDLELAAGIAAQVVDF